MRSIRTKKQNGARKNYELLKLNPTGRLLRKSGEKKDMMMNMWDSRSIVFNPNLLIY